MKDNFCSQVFTQNKAWVKERTNQDPDFFNKLKDQQNPPLLWIGCSDSRVPANQVIGVDPGQVFVHRNISNVVVHTDMNLLSVLEYSVSVLKVKHIAVVGHYGCGGVKAAMEHQHIGIIDGWLRHIRDVYRINKSELDNISDGVMRHDRFVELNVERQVSNLAETTIVQQAWANGQDLEIHGWVYGLKDGLLKDLNVTMSGRNDVDENFRIDF